jgi:hypothetical protein
MSGRLYSSATPAFLKEPCSLAVIKAQRLSFVKKKNVDIENILCIIPSQEGGERMNGIFQNLDTSGKVKALLALKNVTHVEISNLLGVTPETIRNRMVDKRWDIEDLKKIAKRCEIDVTELI